MSRFARQRATLYDLIPARSNKPEPKRGPRMLIEDGLPPTTKTSRLLTEDGEYLILEPGDG